MQQRVWAYTEFSALCWAESEYRASEAWTVEALRLLQCPESLVQVRSAVVKVDALRQACRAFISSRKYAKAGIAGQVREIFVYGNHNSSVMPQGIVSQACVELALSSFGGDHPRYAEALCDYAYYFLNVDNVKKSVELYKKALDVRRAQYAIVNGQCFA